MPGVSQLEIIAIVAAVLFGVIAIVMLILLLAGRQTEGDEGTGDAPYFIPPEGTQQVQDEEPSFIPAPEPAFEPVDDDLVVYDVWTLPIAPRAWGGLEDARTHAFYFPLNVDAGVYVNDYIDIDTHGSRIKLRTLLAGPPDIGATSFVIPEAQPVYEEPEVLPEPAYGEPAAPEPAPRRERPARKVAGDDFMQELESRFQETTGAQTTQVVQSAYYDYKGDIHPVIEVEGIGPVYEEKLNAAGIVTTARLCYEDAGHIAETIGTAVKTVRSWQAMAQLMKVSGIGPQYAEALARAGIEGIDELKRRSPARIADQVNDYLEGLDTNVLGQRITERRIAGWQAAAKTMRRVRQPVPEE